MTRWAPLVVLTLGTACRTTLIQPAMEPVRPIELPVPPGVTDEDVMVSAYRVLTARGHHAVVDHPLAGVVVSEWVDVQPGEYSEWTFTAIAHPIPRRHSYRLVVGEGKIVFAVDCTERPEHGRWEVCDFNWRNTRFIRDRQEILDEILLGAKDRARWRTGHGTSLQPEDDALFPPGRN